MDYGQYEDDFQVTDAKPVKKSPTRKKTKQESTVNVKIPSRRLSSREKATVKPLTKHEKAKL